MAKRNLIDILDTQTAQAAREYSQGYDGTTGIPSVVQQVNEVEDSRRQPTYRTYSPQEQAYRQGMDDALYGHQAVSVERPDNLKPSDRDDVWVGLNDAYNMEDRRARQQSGVEQLVNGISKGVIIAGTTFVDGIVGTAAGIVNLAYQAANGDIERPADALFAFIDNPVSKKLQQVNEWAEKVMPNYYTEEQRESPWYAPVNLFSANFVGDKFLKNTGFMIGAAYSGRVNAGMMSKALAKKSARNAFKGVVKNAAGTKELTTGAEIYKAYKTGDAFMDGVKLTEDLGKAAKQLRNEEWGLKLLGSMAAAAGESRIEAISNTEDYEKRMQAMIDKDREDAVSRVQNEVIARNTVDNPTYTISYNPETGRSEVQYTELGYNIANSLLADIEQRYQDANIKLQQDKAVMANQIFGLNMFVLTGTDLFTFGRFISGGYATNRGAKDYTRRKIGKELAYEATNKERNKSIAKMISVPFAEGPYEEMMQSSIATGAGYNASAKMNQFYGYKIDPEAQDDAVNSVNAILEGIRDTYSDANKWEEGLIGALSSVVGLPGFIEVRDANGQIQYKETKDKNGRTHYTPQRKFQMQGEFWSSKRDISEHAKKSKEVTDALNEVVQNPEFVKRWQSIIRHKALDSIMEQSVREGDVFAYKNAENSQILSDILAFENAGRIQDLYELIDENSNITVRDVDAIRAATKDEKTNVSPYDDMLDEDVVKKVQDHAQAFKNKLDKYVEVRDNIKQVYGTQIDNDYLEAMTWAYMNIDDSEQRMKELSDELIPKLNDIAHVYTALTGEEVKVDVNNMQDLYRFMLNGKARDEFLKTIGKHSAQKLNFDDLFEYIAEMARERSKAYDVLESQKDLTDAERGRIENFMSSALDAYLEGKRLIDALANDPTLHAIPDIEMNDVRKKMVDLANLLFYKTEFLDMLRVLTNNPGAFNKDIVHLHKIRMDEHNNAEAQKLYDSISDDIDQKAFNDIILSAPKNKDQQAKLRKLLNDSSNENIKSKYKEFVSLESAINTLNNVMQLKEDDPDLNVKSAFNSIFIDKIDNDTPSTIADLLKAIDEVAASLDAEPTYNYANSLKNAISTADKRRATAQDAVKETKPEKPEGLEIVEPDKKSEDAASEKKDKDNEFAGFDKEGRQVNKDNVPLDDEPVSATSDTADGASDPNEVMRVAEDILSKLPEETLSNIINNEEVPDALKHVDIDILKDLATVYLEKRDGSLGGEISLQDKKELDTQIDKIDKEGTPQKGDNESKGPKIYEGANGVVLDGLLVTGYDIGALNDEGRAIEYNGNPIAAIMRDEFHTYDFLDSGALAAIEEFYIKEKKSTTPIKFVFANKDDGHKYAALHSYSEKNGKKRDRYNILLAVEITDEILNGVDPKYKDYIKPVKIGDKYYQIAGVLGRLDDNDPSFIAYQQIYNINIESIDTQREEHPEQDLFVGNYKGEPTSTTINKIYSGRRPKAKKAVDLMEIKDTALHGETYFGVAVQSQRTGQIKIFGNKPEGVTFRDPSDIGIKIVPGMVFAFVPMADGAYAYVPVLMARASELHYDAKNDFMSSLKKQVDKLTDSNATIKDKMFAKSTIMRMFNLGKTKFYFRLDEPNAFRFAGQTITSWEDFVKVMQDSPVRVQFYRKFAERAGYANSLIEAGAMSVNYNSLRPYNASFTVNSLRSDSKPAEVKRQRMSQVRQRYTAPGEQRILMMSGKNYVFTDDGIISLDDESRVTDPVTSATLQVSYINKYGENPFGLDYYTVTSKTITLYVLPATLDGSRGEWYVAKEGDGLLQWVKNADRIKEAIEKENRIDAAKEAAKNATGLTIVEEDGSKTRVEAPEIPVEDLKPQGLSVDPVVSQEPQKPAQNAPKRKRGQTAPARRSAPTGQAILREATERDKELAKQIKENSWNPVAITQVFANHGILIDINGMSALPMAQTINDTLDKNPTLTMDQVLSEMNCGKHGGK